MRQGAVWRVRRRLGWDRNPLRRRIDRVEAWLNAVLLIVLLAAGTPLARYTALSTFREQTRALGWERAHRFQVVATLTGRPAAGQGSAAARWKAPKGTVRTGMVAVGGGDTAGAAMPIWVDETGDITAAPPRRRPATQATEAAVAAVVVLLAGLTAAWLLCRRLLDRRRIRSWQSEWLEVEPRWSKYR
jgi:hypothetical protein